MSLTEINEFLASSEINRPGLFPHLDQLERASFIFEVDFGLKTFPTEPGIISIRGPRQYGKSTWLERELRQSIIDFGPASAFYLNGDDILERDRLEQAIQKLLPAFSKQAAVRRLFIDEITAIPNWEVVLKKLSDRGHLGDILIVTTGSNATDLRRGFERLPGRKGKLDRTNYFFTPIAYKEFHRVCHSTLGTNTLAAYLLSGGSPIACAELAEQHFLPEYVIELTRDWIDGEIMRADRSRVSLYNILQVLFKFGGTPVGQAKLAREAGLANNTVAKGFITILHDLGVVIHCYPWDADKQIPILRKPSKFPITNLLAAVTYFPRRLRSIDDFHALSFQEKGIWIEWAVAQELFRRMAIRSEQMLKPLIFWQNKSHEIDFVYSPEHFLEVNYGKSSALEFSWFAHQFPQKQLTVINTRSFSTDQISGITLEEFLLSPDCCLSADKV
ncbi:ATP-binding protein [Coxiella burnetii]|uniref:ATP-binding protein n=1 Tax=Coxiella burnetii TaxID=777 RepID=UPI000CCC455A|nr:AAA family ATPase [Coxiella burnetii]PNT85787.1 ATPase [Coxiella burnetii]